MYFILILKTIFMYIFILFIYRIIGKKEIKELNIVDFIISITIASLVTSSIESKNENILISIVPIIILILMQLLVDYLVLKNEKIRDLVDGKPIVIIKNGQLDFTEMSKLRFSLDDLLSQLRLQGIKSIDKVKYAVLENNGNLSIFNDNSDYPLPIILDGIIDYKVLKEINKDYNWILNILKRKNLELSEVFYAFYTEGKTFIITKSELL